MCRCQERRLIIRTRLMFHDELTVLSFQLDEVPLRASRLEHRITAAAGVER